MKKVLRWTFVPWLVLYYGNVSHCKNILSIQHTFAVIRPCLSSRLIGIIFRKWWKDYIWLLYVIICQKDAVAKLLRTKNKLTYNQNSYTTGKKQWPEINPNVVPIGIQSYSEHFICAQESIRSGRLLLFCVLSISYLTYHCNHVCKEVQSGLFCVKLVDDWKTTVGSGAIRELPNADTMCM